MLETLVIGLDNEMAANKISTPFSGRMDDGRHFLLLGGEPKMARCQCLACESNGPVGLHQHRTNAVTTTVTFDHERLGEIR